MRKKFNAVMEAEICDRYLAGESSIELGKEYGVSGTTIRKILRKHNVEMRVAKMPMISPVAEDEICKDYIAGYSVEQLAKKHKSSRAMIYRILRKNNVDIRPQITIFSRDIKLEKQVCSDYSAGMSMAQLANKYKISLSSVYRLLHKYNIEIRPNFRGGIVNGRRYLWDKRRGRIRAEHDIVWEKFNKVDIPVGFLVHHRDGDPLNNNIENLELMTAVYHIRIHSIAYRIVNNEWEKYCRGCGQWRSLNDFKKLKYEDGHVEVATYCSKECARFAQGMRDSTRDWPDGMSLEILTPH